MLKALFYLNLVQFVIMTALSVLHFLVDKLLFGTVYGVLAFGFLFVALAQKHYNE
jgi:hypothetical protein